MEESKVETKLFLDPTYNRLWRGGSEGKPDDWIKELVIPDFLKGSPVGYFGDEVFTMLLAMTYCSQAIPLSIDEKVHYFKLQMIPDGEGIFVGVFDRLLVDTSRFDYGHWTFLHVVEVKGNIIVRGQQLAVAGIKVKNAPKVLVDRMKLYISGQDHTEEVTAVRQLREVLQDRQRNEAQRQLSRLERVGNFLKDAFIGDYFGNITWQRIANWSLLVAALAAITFTVLLAPGVLGAGGILALAAKGLAGLAAMATTNLVAFGFISGGILMPIAMAVTTTLGAGIRYWMRKIDFDADEGLFHG